jgi:hypothetical protein
MTINTDQSTSTSRRISAAVRDFIRAGGRILVTPTGELTEGGGVPRAFANGSEAEAEECVRACRAYFDVHDLPGADQRISRAVHMLGRRTDNGWLVLDARRKPKEGLH